MPAVLAVLLGLPGAGKTTLAAWLAEQLPQEPALQWRVRTVCFDALMPAALRQLERDATPDSGGPVRAEHHYLIAARYARHCRTTSNMLRSGEARWSMWTRPLPSCLPNRPPEPPILFTGTWRHAPRVTYTQDRVDVVLLDDNMHYHSMRHQAALIAAKRATRAAARNTLMRADQIGFCQIQVTCPLAVCLDRNAARAHPVR